MEENTQISFESLNLKPEILRALEELNFKFPTPIQAKAIPYLLDNGNDLIGFAQTGTGKTGAFSLPIIQRIKADEKIIQALILCPTRELCTQITQDIKHFTKYLQNIKTVAIYGGSSMYNQIRSLKEGAQIVVGTPGRVLDLMKRGDLKISNVNWLVLDEADDMLDKGFKDDLDAILDNTPKEKQTLLFSATMSPWIRVVANKKMRNAHEIKTSTENLGAEKIEHQYVTVHAKDKYQALRRLLDKHPDVYGIVFCRTRRETKEVAAKLIADHYSAEAIHGDIDQKDRSDTMNRFKSKQVQILVATDVAARGIDVNDLTHVINYELPDASETYVHRSGRTGRAGKTGISLSIINMKEKSKIKRIESMMRKRFLEIPVPTGKEICEAQLMNLIDKVKNTDVDNEKLAPYLPSIREAITGLNPDEILMRFISVEFNRFVEHYANNKDLEIQSHSSSSYRSERGDRNDRNDRNDRSDRGDRRDRSDSPRQFSKSNIKMRSYSVNFGKKDGFTPKSLFMMINKNPSLKGIEIGSIRIKSNQTEFEADESYHSKVLKFLSMEKFKGRSIRIN